MCISAGCTDYCSKPIDHLQLVNMIANAANQQEIDPIGSEFSDDLAIRGLLDEFVETLPEMVLEIRQALAHCHHAELQRLAHQLNDAGAGYGYPALTEAAAVIEAAASAGDIEAATLATRELVLLCEAVRLGHESQAAPEESVAQER
jgi:HPt (histidine-containing phosphotransfer) domain-containing protein